MVEPGLAVHPVEAHPYLGAEEDVHPVALQVAVRAVHPLVDHPPAHRRSAARTQHRALGRGRDHGHQVRRHSGVGARARSPHRGARGAVHVGDRDQCRCCPGRPLRGSDRHFRGVGAQPAPWEQIQPPPTALLPPGEPPSAPAQPLAAPQIGRAALPSATYPHTLPRSSADKPLFRPSRSRPNFVKQALPRARITAEVVRPGPRPNKFAAVSAQASVLAAPQRAMPDTLKSIKGVKCARKPLAGSVTPAAV